GAKRMTEEEWVTCRDSRPMLGWVSGRISDRKKYLTWCAFLRRFRSAPLDERFWQAVDALERYADGEASFHAVQRARAAGRRAFGALLGDEKAMGVLQSSFYTGLLAVAYHAAGLEATCASPWATAEERAIHARAPWVWCPSMIAFGARPMRYAK